MDLYPTFHVFLIDKKKKNKQMHELTSLAYYIYIFSEEIDLKNNRFIL